ncbi:MAG TPA: hypothetical protein VHA11_10145 [Bryobacteraceae bacterium]|nr:hypothetical protein [Bryobacteraceae bacterium]
MTDLDRNRKALGGLGRQFAEVFDLINGLLRRGEIKTAQAMIERNRGAVMSLCELARGSAEQQIVLALKLAEVTYSRHTGEDVPALHEMEQTVNRFVTSALGYLEAEHKSGALARGAGFEGRQDSQSKEQTL